MRKILIISGAVFVAGLILGVAVIPTFKSSINPFYHSIGHSADFDDKKDLVEFSERIVVAKYLGQTSHVVAMKNAYDDAVLGETTLAVQRFENVESLKGNAPVGEMTYVATKVADSYNLPDSTKGIFNKENISLSVGDDYAVFLFQIPARPEYKGAYGEVVWTYANEPSIAVIQPGTGNLQFKVTDRYEDQWDTLPGSNAPFELSKAEILKLVSSEGGVE